MDCVSHLPGYLALLSHRLSICYGDVSQMEHATCTCTSITLGCLKGCKINSEYPNIHSIYCYCTALYYITVLVLCTQCTCICTIEPISPIESQNSAHTVLLIVSSFVTCRSCLALHCSQWAGHGELHQNVHGEPTGGPGVLPRVSFSSFFFFFLLLESLFESLCVL